MARHRAANRRRQRLGVPGTAGEEREVRGRHRRQTGRRSRQTGRRSAPASAATTLLALSAAALVAVGGALSFAAAPANGSGEAMRPVAVVGYAGTDVLTADRKPNQASRDAERKALERARLAKLQRAANQQAAQRNARLADLARVAENRANEIASNQWVLPTSGYRLTAGFGDVGSLWTSVHTGLDFAGVPGTPVVSVGSGVVTGVGYAGGYGNRVVVVLEDGTATWYCHLEAFSVRVGDPVDPGQQVGTMGSTGNSTGPHLHFEVRPDGGDPVDPYLAMVEHGLIP